ncbi:uncharacterized protein BN467_00305 [Prevotella sp. CAG:1124]|nr:uncharacterized protein BN467_00305 [Prevotella sp. CAG:1124]
MIDSNISTSLYGEHMGFELLNDSMDDGTSQAYVRGEILMTRKVSPCELPQIMDKFDFVIKTKSDDVIYVGRITACDVEGNTITLHRLNTNYKDMTINVAEIEWAYRIYESRRKR